MALKQTIEAILTHLTTVQVVTPDSVTTNLHARVWNNQVEFEKTGELQIYQKPAVFIEFVFGEGGNIGQNFNGNDIILRLHLVHTHYNTEGSFEQDLLIFDLRDLIVAALNRKKYIHLSALQKVSEAQDFSHDNVYHYTIDFTSHFVDNLDDAISDALTVSAPPLYLIQKINADGTFYNLNSYVATETLPACVTGTAQFNGTLTFNKYWFFTNGSTITLSITASDTIIDNGVTGLGFTYNSTTKVITITNAAIFMIAYIFVDVANTLCGNVTTCDIVVASYTGLIHHGVAGTQQTLSQTYTP